MLDECQGGAQVGSSRQWSGWTRRGAEPCSDGPTRPAHGGRARVRQPTHQACVGVETREACRSRPSVAETPPTTGLPIPCGDSPARVCSETPLVAAGLVGRWSDSRDWAREPSAGELGDAPAGHDALRARAGRNSKRPMRWVQISAAVIHCVGQLDHAQSPRAGRHHLDGKDHERPHAHHVVCS